MPRRLPAALALTALLLGACGGDDQRSGADVTTPQTTVTTEAGPTTSTSAGTGTTVHDGEKPAPNRITIVGKNIAFSPDKITVPVDHEVEIIFDNRDTAVPHNIHFDTPKEIKTDVKNGKASGVKDRFKLRVAEAGTYEYICDVHPAMKGELTVK